MTAHKTSWTIGQQIAMYLDNCFKNAVDHNILHYCVLTDIVCCLKKWATYMSTLNMVSFNQIEFWTMAFDVHVHGYLL